MTRAEAEDVKVFSEIRSSGKSSWAFESRNFRPVPNVIKLFSAGILEV